MISASSWREGQKLVKKILGPAPRIEQDRRAVSSDRTGRERATKSGMFLSLDLLHFTLLNNTACLQTSEIECSEIEVYYQITSIFNLEFEGDEGEIFLSHG